MHRRHLPIANPCHENWDAMDRAEGARRFCDQCDKHVHDLSALSEPEARSLLSVPREGRLCVRYRTDARGGIRFRVPSIAAPLPRRVLATVRATMAAGLLATLATSSGCTDPNRIPSGVESERCTYEIGPFSYALERGQGSCPEVVRDEVALGTVAIEPEPAPIKGELVTVEPMPEMGEEEAIAEPMGKVAPPQMGQAPAPVHPPEPVEEVELMGDIAGPIEPAAPAPEPCDGAIPSGAPPVLD